MFAVSVRGRLRKSIHAVLERHWRASLNYWHHWIWLQMPLLQIPPPFVAKNYKSAVQDSAFVESSISELSSLECIAEVFTPPAVLNPLSVSIQKSGKKRLILDLRHVNQYLFKSKFRCEDIYCKGNAERWGFHVFLCFEIRLPPRRDFSRA